MTNVDVIKALKSLDLSKYPYNNVKEHVSMFAPKILGVWIPKGQLIERIRPDAGVYERKKVSYRPAVLNKRPQRATLPGQTAFYGTLSHMMDPTWNTRYVSLLEASKLYRKGPQENGEETYTWSRWMVADKIHLGVVVDETVFANATHNPLLLMAKQEWIKGKAFTDGAMQSDEYNTFVVEQFSKMVSNDYEYIISATISDMIIYACKFDGVIYPPVQAAGDYGMNVAIRPDVVNSKLLLTDASEMEYVQENGKGNLRFTRHGIPVEMDERGLKRWRYE